MEIAAAGAEEGGAARQLFSREGGGLEEPLLWTGAVPRPEAAARIEWALPEGVRLESVLSGDWRPHL